MCKLLAITEVENKANAEAFARKAVRFVTENDDDGLGIMRLGENGIHIQRWVEVPIIPSQRSTLDRFKNVLELNRNTEGVRSRDLYALAIHGRFATCAVNLENTHPFYRMGTALMHNGIIRNHNEYEKVIGTCDSEALLSQYIDHNVRRHPKFVTDAMKGIQGYFAAIVFNDNGVIDIWRDGTATLVMAHVKGVGVVVCTTEDIIINTARACKAKITAVNKIKPFTVIRWRNGHNPIVKRFFHEEPAYVPSGGGNECGTQRNLFPEMEPDEYTVRPVDVLEKDWQRELELERTAELADDYELAKLRGFKGTEEDYFRHLEMEVNVTKVLRSGHGGE